MATSTGPAPPTRLTARSRPDVRRRRSPITGTGAGIFSLIHVDDTAAATRAAIEQQAESTYTVVDDQPAPVADWLPAYAQILGAPAPRRVPAWAGRALGGSYAVYLMTQMPGASTNPPGPALAGGRCSRAGARITRGRAVASHSPPAAKTRVPADPAVEYIGAGLPQRLAGTGCLKRHHRDRAALGVTAVLQLTCGRGEEGPDSGDQVGRGVKGDREQEQEQVGARGDDSLLGIAQTRPRSVAVLPSLGMSGMLVERSIYRLRIEATSVRSWLAKKVIDRHLALLRAGNYRPLLRLYADDIRFVFPGDSTWSGEVRGKEAMSRWLQRLASAGLQNFADEVIVNGPPWNMMIAMRGRDYVKDPDGQVVYQNRYVLWGRMAWGLIKEYEAYEDTARLKALDDYVASGGLPEPAA